MLLTADGPDTDRYRVEVSGWDSSLEFFVEKSELAWSEEAGKQVALTHAVRTGTMIFVRLLKSMSTDRTSPVAYRADLVTTNAEGFHQFRLTQVRPLPARTTEPKNRNSRVCRSNATLACGCGWLVPERETGSHSCTDLRRGARGEDVLRPAKAPQERNLK